MSTAIPESYKARAMAFIHAHPGHDVGGLVALALMEAGQGGGVSHLGLTKQQRAARDFILAHELEHGVPPSFDEIREGLGLASKSGVHRLVHALVERGAVVRLPNRWRSISVRRAA